MTTAAGTAVCGPQPRSPRNRKRREEPLPGASRRNSAGWQLGAHAGPRNWEERTCTFPAAPRCHSSGSHRKLPHDGSLTGQRQRPARILSLLGEPGRLARDLPRHRSRRRQSRLLGLLPPALTSHSSCFRGVRLPTCLRPPSGGPLPLPRRPPTLGTAAARMHSFSKRQMAQLIRSVAHACHPAYASKRH